MKRRELMLAALTAPALGLPLLARAHHGWSSLTRSARFTLKAASPGPDGRTRTQNWSSKFPPG
jgi:hypothetical protein